MDSLPEDAPAPRLCHLIKWPDFDGYGFNLHAERSNPGQFIGKIDEDSPAQMAGLREGDRIVEVNGVNISNENHRQVVERIKSIAGETKLLVVDPETDLWYKEQDLVVKSSQLNVVYIKTPTPRPHPDSPRAKFHHQAAGSVEQVSSLSPSAGGSSLETSDFNDDSIEQMAQMQSPELQSQTAQTKAPSMGASVPTPPPQPQPLVSVASRRVPSPPMSPDSGKGDEEPAGGNSVLTVEAEINRQLPQSPEPRGLEEGKAKEKEKGGAERDESVRREEEVTVVAQASNQEEEEAANSIQPDSLSQCGSSMSPTPASCQVSKARISSLNFSLSHCYQSRVLAPRMYACPCP